MKTTGKDIGAKDKKKSAPRRINPGPFVNIGLCKRVLPIQNTERLEDIIISERNREAHLTTRVQLVHHPASKLLQLFC
jgi:hypothetical protein